jgi:hypothetical protein
MKGRIRVERTATRSLRLVASCATLAALVQLTASAHPGGVSGRTLKGPNPGCSCHGSQSATPAVVIKAPATLAVAQAVQCTVTVGGSATGVDIATSLGSLTAVSGSLHLLNGELTHNGPTNPGTYIFTYTAPPTAGAQTMYATGVESYPGNWNHATNHVITITAAAPPAPVLLLPANGAAEQPLTVTLSWSPAAGATAYHLQVSTDSLFATTLINDSSLSVNSALAGGLSGATPYFWRVHGLNTAGPGAWSARWRFSTTAAVTHSYSYDAQWNIVSVPLSVGDFRATSVFPTGVSHAYAFDPLSGYVRRDTLEHGSGYWLKFSSGQSVSMTGLERSADTIAVQQGWNLVGSITFPVPVGSVTSVPPGIVMSAFYGYAGLYASVVTLQPGKAYWVKCNSPGVIILQ